MGQLNSPLRPEVQPLTTHRLPRIPNAASKEAMPKLPTHCCMIGASSIVLIVRWFGDMSYGDLDLVVPYFSSTLLSTALSRVYCCLTIYIPCKQHIRRHQFGLLSSATIVFWTAVELDNTGNVNIRGSTQSTHSIHPISRQHTACRTNLLPFKQLPTPVKLALLMHFNRS